MKKLNRSPSLMTGGVILAALGYFVDIYDLVLFSIVRVPSLKSLGLDSEALMSRGILLLDLQMAGMLVGGIFWGVLGDRRGRLSVLFGSIFLYSIANILNGFVNSVEQYAVLRVVAGIGLAGELGAGITLVSEILPKERRGYGTMIVATVGVSGAILAGVVAEHFDWRVAYFVGGGLGIALLLLRISVFESGLFKSLESQSVKQGDFLSFFRSYERGLKYLRCILIGVPIWYVVGILITFSPEFARVLGVSGEVTGGRAILFCYLGMVFGDFLSGWLSQWLKSRKKAILTFQSLTALAAVAYFVLDASSLSGFYAVCGLLGVAVGYWAVFVTVAAEQFGTNLRATAATTVPNFVRGSVVPITLIFQTLKSHLGIVQGAIIVGALCWMLAVWAASRLPETYGRDLNFLELS